MNVLCARSGRITSAVLCSLFSVCCFEFVLMSEEDVGCSNDILTYGFYYPQQDVIKTGRDGKRSKKTNSNLKFLWSNLKNKSEIGFKLQVSIRK